MLAEMEEKLSDVEENNNWFDKSTNWYFRRELSRCCHCSGKNYDPNSYLPEFKTSYGRGYYKYAQKPQLEFDVNGIVILIDQTLPKEDSKAESNNALGNGVNLIINTDK